MKEISNGSYVGETDESGYLKISDVGEEEADEGEGQTPLWYGADDVSSVTLKQHENSIRNVDE